MIPFFLSTTKKYRWTTFWSMQYLLQYYILNCSIYLHTNIAIYCRSFEPLSFLRIPIWICSNFCRGPLATIHTRGSLHLDPASVSVDAVPFSGESYTEMTPWEDLLISWASEPDHLCFRDTQRGSWSWKMIIPPIISWRCLMRWRSVWRKLTLMDRANVLYIRTD